MYHKHTKYSINKSIKPVYLLKINYEFGFKLILNIPIYTNIYL